MAGEGKALGHRTPLCHGLIACMMAMMIDVVVCSRGWIEYSCTAAMMMIGRHTASRKCERKSMEGIVKIVNGSLFVGIHCFGEAIAIQRGWVLSLLAHASDKRSMPRKC